MKKRFEVWATFKNGATVKVETHKRLQDAQNAIGAMNSRNQNDLRCGGGFPYGVPEYTIKQAIK